MTAGLEKLGFSPKTINAFGGLFVAETKMGRYLFPSAGLPGGKTGRPEVLYLDGTRTVPAEFLWKVPQGAALGKTDVFLFQSATDAMAFFELKGSRALRGSALVAMGSGPGTELLQYLKKGPYRNFVLCFPNDFLGRICDIRAGLCLSDRPASIAISTDGTVSIESKERKCAIRPEALSLSRVERDAGINIRPRTLKPPTETTFFEEMRTARAGPKREP